METSRLFSIPDVPEWNQTIACGSSSAALCIWCWDGPRTVLGALGYSLGMLPLVVLIFFVGLFYNPSDLLRPLSGSPPWLRRLLRNVPTEPQEWCCVFWNFYDVAILCIGGYLAFCVLRVLWVGALLLVRRHRPTQPSEAHQSLYE